MFKSACPRVASLLVPRFPIVVARRLHGVPSSAPLALIKGEGSHARVAAAELHEDRSMAVVGWSSARIRALLPSALLIPWNGALEEQLHHTAMSILRSLEPLTPRCSVLGMGLFTLEPFSYEPDESGERDFATRTLSHMKSMELADVRLGLADAVITAAAVARHLTSAQEPVVRVPPGQDPQALEPLPIHAIPLSERVLVLLESLGIHTVGQLQKMDPGPLVARFGDEGQRSWRFAHGQDPRQPQSLPVSLPTRIHRPLEAPCSELDLLFFVLRPSLEQLTNDLSRLGRGIASLTLVLWDTEGGRLEIPASAAQPTRCPERLFDLLTRALHQQDLHGSGPIEALELVATDLSPIQELQGDLFDQVRADPLTLETTFQRLVHRLGAEGVVTPTLIDSHHPERQSAWRPLHLDTAPLPPEDRAWRQPHRACVRRLEPPRPLILVAPDRWRLEGDRHEELKIQAWRSSERLSGHWWSTPYDRTEHWAQLEDGRLIWLSHRHGTDRWFLQGWLD